MFVDIWHLILLADIAVCYCKSITMGDPAGHTLAGNILDANKMCVTYDFDVEHLNFEEFLCSIYSAA